MKSERNGRWRPVNVFCCRTRFRIDVSGAMESMPPTPAELRILREEIDPHNLILK